MVDFVIINSKEDTNDFLNIIDGFNSSNILINPSKGAVRKLLKESNNDIVFCGHGDEMGLYNKDLNGYVISSNDVHLLRNHNIIGIWCFAGNFADRYDLHGFFTSMFISNIDEANYFNFNTTPDIITAENVKFSTMINELLKKQIPYSEWVDILQKQANTHIPFVRFNYEALYYNK